MDINHLHLGVDGIDRSRAFYEKLGFRADTWHGDALFLVNDEGFELALAPHGRADMPEWFHVGAKLASADAVRALRAELGPNVSAGGGMDSEKNWWKNFEVDVLHTVRGCEALLPRLEASGQGSVVVISSTNALETFYVPMAYNAMKAALVTYAKQLSQFVGKKNIRVNSVCPGPIYFEGGAWEMIKSTNPKMYEATLRAMPNGRFGAPEEVARVVVFLASPAASIVTGANVVADNGFTKRVQY